MFLYIGTGLVPDFHCPISYL